MKGTIMNLAIVSLAIMGALVTVYAIIYTLTCDMPVTLPRRIFPLALLLGGYVGVVALIMLLLGIPIS